MMGVQELALSATVFQFAGCMSFERVPFSSLSPFVLIVSCHVFIPPPLRGSPLGSLSLLRPPSE